MDESEMQLDYEDDSTLELESSEISGKPHENLKISIDNEEDPNPSVAFVKLETSSSESVPVTDDSSNPQIKINIVPRSAQLKSKYHTYQDKVKHYENKSTDFTSGIDITSEETRRKRKERAKRFGVEEEIIDDKKLDINVLYASLGVTEEDLEQTGERQIRCNTVMLRGVDDMNTQDIFAYFSKYPPTNLEWIDDKSCNVVFSTTEDANRALINMSEPVKTSLVSIKQKKRKCRRTSSDTASSTNKTVVDLTSSLPNVSSEADDTIDLLEDITESEEVKDNALDSSQQMEVEEGEVCSDEDSGVFMDESEVPPGKWRLATPCSKTQCKLFMRLATKADVKVKGAENKSKYYVKYGNPNYGGLHGLISKSKKNRFRRSQGKILEQEAKDAVSNSGRSRVTYDTDDLFGEAYVEEDGSSSMLRPSVKTTEMSSIHQSRKRGRVLSEESSNEIDEVTTNIEVAEKKRKPMMKMAADEEEEKIERVRAHSKAVVASLDIRDKLNRKHMERHSNIVDSQYTHDTPEEEPSRPDLRSRLSRRNDW